VCAHTVSFALLVVCTTGVYVCTCYVLRVCIGVCLCLVSCGHVVCACIGHVVCVRVCRVSCGHLVGHVVCV